MEVFCTSTIDITNYFVNIKLNTLTITIKIILKYKLTTKSFVVVFKQPQKHFVVVFFVF